VITDSVKLESGFENYWIETDSYEVTSDFYSRFNFSIFTARRYDNAVRPSVSVSKWLLSVKRLSASLSIYCQDDTEQNTQTKKTTLFIFHIRTYKYYSS